MKELDAVVLAGGKNSAAMRALTGVENRALVTLGDRTMLERVVAALRDAGLARVFVVGDVPDGEGYSVVTPGGTLVDNLFGGIAAAGQGGHGDRPVLAVTSDIPFLTGAAVADFAGRAAATGADFCYPIIPLAVCRSRFPEMRRTALKTGDGEFTGGNLMLLAPQALLRHRETILRAYAARKRPLALGGMLGWGLLARVALAQTVRPGLVTVAALEAGVSRLLGCRAAAVVSEYAEIGTDVDRPEDVAAARALLARPGANHESA